MPYYSLEHWIIAAVGADFCYYWAHRWKSFWFKLTLANIDFRLVHEVNLGWSAHQVHHSSEDYNLSTAIRQSLLQFWFMQIPCLAAAVLGVHPSMFWTHYRYDQEFFFIKSLLFEYKFDLAILDSHRVNKTYGIFHGIFLQYSITSSSASRSKPILHR